MNQQHYMDELKRHLSRLPYKDVQDILADYHEHFAIAKGAGKSDAEIIQGLGHPRVVAQSHVMNTWITEAGNSPSTLHRGQLLLRILMMFLILAPLNFLMLIGPFLIVGCLVVAGWSVPIAIAGVAVAAAGVLLVSSAPVPLGLLLGGSVFFAFLGLLGIAALGALLMLLVTRIFINLVAAYVRWNLNFMGVRNAAGA